jgi:hypothetical protein
MARHPSRLAKERRAVSELGVPKEWVRPPQYRHLYRFVVGATTSDRALGGAVVRGSRRPQRQRYDPHMTGEARTFFMHLPKAVLAFDPVDDEYLVYSLPPRDEALPKDEWDAIRPSLEPTGSIPLAEVTFDDTARFIRMDTTDIDRFVAA